MKKNLAILLALLLTLSLLGGCGRTAEEEAPPASDPTAGESAAPDGTVERTPDAEELQENYFRRIAACQPGTAGASLKAAQAACGVLSFSVSRQLRGADADQLRERLLEAWEGLSEDERAAFDGSFLNVCGLLDSCFADWESCRALFEDAGAADEMEYLLAVPGARDDWSVLMSHTLTLGNSDGEK